METPIWQFHHDKRSRETSENLELHRFNLFLEYKIATKSVKLLQNLFFPLQSDYRFIFLPSFSIWEKSRMCFDLFSWC